MLDERLKVKNREATRLDDLLSSVKLLRMPANAGAGWGT